MKNPMTALSMALALAAGSPAMAQTLEVNPSVSNATSTVMPSFDKALQSFSKSIDAYFNDPDRKTSDRCKNKFVESMNDEKPILDFARKVEWEKMNPVEREIATFAKEQSVMAAFEKYKSLGDRVDIASALEFGLNDREYDKVVQSYEEVRGLETLFCDAQKKANAPAIPSP